MRTSLLLAVLSVLLLMPTAAQAHAQLDKSSVPAGTTQTLTVTALSERPLEHNTSIEVKIPDGFTAPACIDKADWSCDIAATDGGTIVHFVRTSGTDILLNDTYAFTVVTSLTPGDYLVPIIQTYSSGTEARWTNPDPDGEGPAPHLEVTAGGSAVENDDDAPEHDSSDGDSGSTPRQGDTGGDAGGAQPTTAPTPAPAAPASTSGGSSASPASSPPSGSPSSSSPSSSGSGANGSTSDQRPALSSQPTSPGGAAPASGLTATPSPSATADALTDVASDLDTAPELSGGEDELAQLPNLSEPIAGSPGSQAQTSAEPGGRGLWIFVAVLLLAGAGAGTFVLRRART